MVGWSHWVTGSACKEGSAPGSTAAGKLPKLGSSLQTAICSLLCAGNKAELFRNRRGRIIPDVFLLLMDFFHLWKNALCSCSPKQSPFFMLFWFPCNCIHSTVSAHPSWEGSVLCPSLAGIIPTPSLRKCHFCDIVVSKHTQNILCKTKGNSLGKLCLALQMNSPHR